MVVAAVQVLAAAQVGPVEARAVRVAEQAAEREKVTRDFSHHG